MKRNVVFFVFLLTLTPALAWGQVISDMHFNALSEGGVNCGGYSGFPSPEIVSVSGSPDPSNVLKINFPEGYGGGYNTAWCSGPKYNSDETYVQLYVFFPTGYQFHTVANKLAYTYLALIDGVDPGNLFMGVFGSDRQVVIQTQPVSESKANGAVNKVYYNNKKYIRIDTNSWYKINYYVKLNTSGVSNGIIRIWVNDTLVSEYTDMNMRGGTLGASNFYKTSLMPIWGGLYQTKSGADFFYMDRWIVSATPAGGSGGGLPSDSLFAQKEPNPPKKLIIE